MAKFSFSSGGKVAAGIAIGLALGAAGGAGAVSMTRPAVQMAPMVVTPLARLTADTGIVTVKGQVAEVYGDRFVLADASGRTMVDAGRDTVPAKGATMRVQGRFDDGQLRASYLVDAAGKVTQVGPGPRPGGRGPDGKGPGGPGHAGPHGPRPDGAPCAPGAVPPPPPADGTAPAPVPAPMQR